jgi:hypothetical protein
MVEHNLVGRYVDWEQSRADSRLCFWVVGHDKLPGVESYLLRQLYNQSRGS